MENLLNDWIAVLRVVGLLPWVDRALRRAMFIFLRLRRDFDIERRSARSTIASGRLAVRP
jgi:hypothetical protein